MTRMTAWEIVGNRRDLTFNVLQDMSNKKWAIHICRGPGHNYKQLITSDYGHLESKVAAIACIRALLEAARGADPDRDAVGSMSQDDIERICVELTGDSGTSATYQWPD